MTDVVVVGGGLAGMTATLRLLERGYDVTLYESSGRLGGKAGANLRDGYRFDHAYHVFPPWYLNAWRLIDDLGIRDNLVPCAEMLELRAGAFPQFLRFQNFTSPRFALQNLTSGFLPLPHMIIMGYATLHLASQAHRRTAYLDQISVNGFIRSHFYSTDPVAEQMREVMLKAVADPSYLVSAMTVARILSYWLKYPMPMYSIMRGNLQQLFIDPISSRIEQLGGKICRDHRLQGLAIEGSRVAQLRFVEGGGNPVSIAADRVILALPVEAVCRLIDDDVYRAAPALADLRNLRVKPMASLHLYFDQRIPGLPAHHVHLANSAFDLSFIDLSQNWSGLDGTALSITACDAAGLQGLSVDTAVAAVKRELTRYIPDLDTFKLIASDFQDHAAEPLLMNDVGAWQYRPRAATQLANLYLAGDYCQTAVNLASMEGAIAAGLDAAETLRKEVGKGAPIDILEPTPYPGATLTLGRWLLLPVVALAKAWTWFTPALTT